MYDCSQDVSENSFRNQLDTAPFQDSSSGKLLALPDNRGLLDRDQLDTAPFQDSSSGKLLALPDNRGLLDLGKILQSWT